ncbi:hypothetical protein SSX86_007357 [Deinandra increscens subsp. villosa]|uniref:Trichome birefringence-like C-terminal domain-containing protein n=1 Tax=Deinandra increscens subsp. villosa TaxID=3103831 RepID=A0AAP0H7U7_9ASTR
MRKTNCSIGSCDMQTMIQCSFFIFFLGGLATLSFYRNYNKEEVAGVLKVNLANVTTNESTTTPVFGHQGKPKSVPPSSLSSACDLFSGRWVYDNRSHYPLYKEYEFDAKTIVERLRGKRLLFVGDSLNRNQWNSMICMLHSYIPGVKKAGGDLNGLLHTFRAIDYNISIDFYWAPMLVESNGDSPTNHHLDSRIVGIKAIETHARHWVNSDILIFNSYHWWRSPVLKMLKSAGSLLDDPNQEYEEVDSLSAYKMALKTWSDWAHTHIDPLKTKLFFMGVTATHSKARDWGGMKKGNCYGEIEPVMDNGFWESRTDPRMLSVLESSLSKLKARGLNAQIINVTQLTQCRKDAHTTVYRKYWRPLTDEQKKKPRLASDCSHWCLPGVPDIWNELLLAYILRKQNPSDQNSTAGKQRKEMMDT